MFKDVLKVINKKFNLGMHFNHTTLEVTYPNGSILYLMGMDSTPDEMDKAFGQKYRLCLLDEAGSWKQDQEQLVYEVLEPAIADMDGTIGMTGSPDRETHSHFFTVTNKPGSVKGWSCHSWTWAENPHMKDKMQKKIDELIERNPRIVETAPYKRMYLGQWVIDPGSLVYKYTDARNTADRLPKENEYNFVLGLDLGFTDATAFVIAAYSQYDPCLYFVEVLKKEGLDITGVAENLAFFRQKYNPVKWIVDGASKQAVEELKNRHNFPLEASDKMGKADMIEIMNADFTMGRIKLLPNTQPLKDEYGELIWDLNSKKKEEHPGYDNHACDGALYSWRHCFHYLSQPRVDSPKPGSEEEMEAWWERESRAALKQDNQDWLKNDVGEHYGFKE